jgi:hypothetical protein
MARQEQIANAGYQLEVQWECEFDKSVLSLHPQLKNNPLFQHSPPKTRDVLYGGRTEAILHYKIHEGENFSTVM